MIHFVTHPKFKIYRKQLLILLMGCLAWPGLQSCESFTAVDLPDSQLASEAVFEDYNTANAALADIYARIRNNGLLTGAPTGLSHQLGLYTDELQLYVGNQSFYTNNVAATGSEVLELWNSSYGQIYAANSAIERLNQSVSLSSTDKDRLLGEAFFLRALIHFYLFNIFGDIPYITTTDYQINRSVARIGYDAIYNTLKQDLAAAITLLPENYTAQERTRANRAAALSLMARVCLYKNEWTEAETAASTVINMQGLYQLSSVTDAFKKESVATILQLSPELAGGNTLDAQTFIFLSGPPPRSALTQNLYDAFSDEDLRKIHWIGTVSTQGATWYYPSKYKHNTNTTASQEYSILLRLPELYLIRAEARLEQGNIDGAKNDLNSVRSLAGLTDVTSNDINVLRTAILNERRLELFSELGHRFFDLKRHGLLSSVLVNIKPGWQSTDALLPIPESEILLNNNLLPQNDGY